MPWLPGVPKMGSPDLLVKRMLSRLKFETTIHNDVNYQRTESLLFDAKGMFWPVFTKRSGEP